MNNAQKKAAHESREEIVSEIEATLAKLASLMDRAKDAKLTVCLQNNTNNIPTITRAYYNEITNYRGR